MKTYLVKVLINNGRTNLVLKQGTTEPWVEEMITAEYLSIGTNYYYFKTDEGKSHYYPIDKTVITEI